MNCLRHAIYSPRITVGGVESFSLLSVRPGCRILVKSVAPRALFLMPRDNGSCPTVVHGLYHSVHDGLRKGRNDGTGYAERDMARQAKWADPALRREREGARVGKKERARARGGERE